MRRIASIFLSLFLVISCFACATNTGTDNLSDYTKHEMGLPKAFDTYMLLIGFTKTKKEFEKYGDVVSKQMLKLDKYFDIYNNYEGINNLKTINDNAGIAPVKVDREIIDLMLFGIDAYEKTDGMVNITMGAVLRLWHDARTYSLDNPGKEYLPDIEQLKAASLNTDISNLIVDEKASTVFLKESGMSLDVGAIAKGYSVDLAAREAEKAGLKSGIFNGGGNVLTFGAPLDPSRQRWGVGIQDPLNKGEEATYADTVYTTDMAIVTSGDYQRFYTVDGIAYNHIISPETLMPADRYAGVTILHPDSGIADMLSTALFILPIDEGEQLLKKFNAEALWIDHDGNKTATDGYKAISRVFSNYSAAD